MDQGSMTLVLDLANAFERGESQSSSCVGLGNALQIPQTDYVSLMWLLRAPAARSVRRVRGGAALHPDGLLPCVEVELLSSTHCAPRCPQRSDEFASAHEAEGLRERYQRLHGSTKWRVPRRCRKGF